MNENDFEQIIWSHLARGVMDEMERLGVMDNVPRAAHAIAEKLAEGVVWSGPAEARRLHGPENREQMYLHYPHIDRPGHTECFTEGWPLEHGQRVTVTVTKEE